jgi:glutamate N-acetyltransferase/amino-acid N-acetyltransferase
MAVGEGKLPELFPVSGVRLGVTEAHVKYAGRKDLVILEALAEASVAGVFTRNAFCAAPVQICQQNLRNPARSDEQAQYFVINTGYANAGTGRAGFADANAVCEALAGLAGVPVANVFPFSTGVIGERLPVERIVAGLSACFDNLAEQHWLLAAQGIMTTDTRPKVASCRFDIAGVPITITGIAKGAGMIKPDMATMLAFVATDARIESSLLQQLLSSAADQSFNQATVDGDTSTNDACMLVATGASGQVISVAEPEQLARFSAQLDTLCVELAQAIVKDGEGATHFVTVRVREAVNREEARQVAYTVAHSPLVKTALFACDPNWGRILAAIGRSGIEQLDVSKVDVRLDDVQLCEQGGLAASYREADCARVMRQDAYTIDISLGRGNASADVWTIDFSYDYVRINADYRS